MNPSLPNPVLRLFLTSQLSRHDKHDQTGMFCLLRKAYIFIQNVNLVTKTSIFLNSKIEINIPLSLKYRNSALSPLSKNCFVVVQLLSHVRLCNHMDYSMLAPLSTVFWSLP